VYVPICHWVWGSSGWLDKLGVLDFAGGTVVHVSSGTSGLVAATMLGPRHHKLAGVARPNSVPFVLLGAALLWFGWNGFNGGSALAANAVAARAVLATNLAAASSMLVWVAVESARLRQPSSVGAMVGAVAGLVVITPAAGFVSPVGAVCMGAIGAPICYSTVVLLNRFEKLDDSLDAFGLHGAGGCVGAILTGLFAEDGDPSRESGLFYGGGASLLWKQCVGASAGMAYSGLVTAALFGLLRCIMQVRVQDQAEERGVDKFVHGEDAYSWRRTSTLPAGFNLDEDVGAGPQDQSSQPSDASTDGAESA